ncbi:MAG: hypothetical protein QOE65_2468 [Solirubrobacteraceae bacterium]|jgi:hypothetical protein|nr:hypothetical protein [Solirubrobacteraceae bacterium]
MRRFNVTVTTGKDSAGKSTAALQTLCTGPGLVRPASPPKSPR